MNGSVSEQLNSLFMVTGNLASFMFSSYLFLLQRESKGVTSFSMTWFNRFRWPLKRSERSLKTASIDMI